MNTLSKFFFLAILALVMLVSCSENKENDTDKYNDPFRKNLFNPYFLDQLFLTPNSFGPIWISDHVRQLDIDRISIIMKGGSRPDNVLEKFVYSFNDKGQNNSFQYYFFNKSSELINETNFTYKGNFLSRIDIIKYYQIGNLPPVTVYHDKEKMVFYKSKANGKNDSLFFYPSKLNPKIIIDKIGKFHNFIEIFVPKGTGATEIRKQIEKIDSNLRHFDLAEKLLTYTENDFPVESYHLGDNWNQLELAKQWEYNKYMQPIHFKQWLHGTKIKDVDILYNENSLPKRIIFNRKKYYLIYKKL